MRTNFSKTIELRICRIHVILQSRPFFSIAPYTHPLISVTPLGVESLLRVGYRFPITELQGKVGRGRVSVCFIEVGSYFRHLFVRLAFFVVAAGVTGCACFLCSFLSLGAVHNTSFDRQ